MFIEGVSTMMSMLKAAFWISMVADMFQFTDDPWGYALGDSNVLATAVVIAIVAGVIMICFTLPTGAKPPDYVAIRKKSGSAALSGGLWLLLLVILSAEAIHEPVMEIFDWDGVAVLAYYAIAREYLILINTVSLVGHGLILLRLVGETDAPAGHPGGTQPPVSPPPAATPTGSTGAPPASVVCPACGYEQPGNRTLCWKCGVKLDGENTTPPPSGKICPGCHNPVTEGMRFCPHCGTALTAGQ